MFATSERRNMGRGFGFQNDLRNCARKCARVATWVALWALCALAARAQQASADLTDRSLSDLMNMQVTSVSKTAEPLSRTAAAIFVITQQDILRSGATSI